MNLVLHPSAAAERYFPSVVTKKGGRRGNASNTDSNSQASQASLFGRASVICIADCVLILFPYTNLYYLPLRYSTALTILGLPNYRWQTVISSGASSSRGSVRSCYAASAWSARPFGI